MNISRLIFPFKDYKSLANKWWHRLFSVFFFLAEATVLISLVILFFEFLPENKFNITVKTNLEEFTRNSAQDIINTIPLFVGLENRVGCLENNSVRSIYNYELEGNACSSDLRGNIIEIATMLYSGNPEYSSVRKLQSDLITLLDNDMSKRYCFIRKDLECSSNEIISYERNIIFYLESLLISVIIIYILGLLFQIMYFKGLIYIIYGKAKR